MEPKAGKSRRSLKNQEKNEVRKFMNFQRLVPEICLPPEHPLTIVKIDNIQKNNMQKTKNNNYCRRSAEMRSKSAKVKVLFIVECKRVKIIE